MINSAKQLSRRSSLYNLVHNQYRSAEDLPAGLILLDTIKTLETDLQRRKILNDKGLDQMHPLWFLAETERNIFLWRTGHSLDDAPLFEFWVDMNCLIDKRVQQIEHYDPENPFFNSLWGFSSGSPESLVNECDYLKTFKEVLGSIISHASALSTVTSMIAKELSSAAEKTIVILPSAAKNRAIS